MSRPTTVLAATLGLTALALAGSAARSTGAGTLPGVTYFEAAQVSAAFAKGMPLLERDGYKIHASRREQPGMVEVHVKDTDIIYVLEGSATFVTGGKMIGGKTVAPDEIRGESVEGGTDHHLVKGDVIVVPNQTPHWFKQVQGPLLYYTVKVSS